MISRRNIRRIVSVTVVVISLTYAILQDTQKQTIVLHVDMVYVSRVVDGDTIVLEYKGTTTKARLIGIDTPESVDPRKPIECFGLEAKAYATEKLSGKYVYVETDSSQGIYDVYGRMLVYVYLSTSTPSFNEELIQKGYAKEYTYKNAYAYVRKFKLAEEYARINSMGLWNSAICKK